MYFCRLMVTLTDQQLKVASIVDLTDDVELMRQALDDHTFIPADVEMWSDDGKIHSLFEFGIFTKNEAFLDRLEKVFSDELDKMYNE